MLDGVAGERSFAQLGQGLQDLGAEFSEDFRVGIVRGEGLGVLCFQFFHEVDVLFSPAPFAGPVSGDAEFGDVLFPIAQGILRHPDHLGDLPRGPVDLFDFKTAVTHVPLKQYSSLFRETELELFPILLAPGVLLGCREYGLRPLFSFDIVLII